MAKIAPSPQSPVAAAGTSPRSVGASAGGGTWLRNAGVIFALICVLGVLPVAIGGQTLNLWRLPSALSLPGVRPNVAITYAVALKSPVVGAVSATTATILALPETGAPIAILQGGYPVTINQYATVDGDHSRWAHVAWQGPVANTGASGGQGWTLATALTTTGSGQTQIATIGDLGALALALGGAMAPYGDHFIGDVYFPNNNARYYTANAQQPFALGSGLRNVLLADLYSVAEAQRQAVNTPLTQGLARADASSGATAYHELGDAPGVGKFLTNSFVDGVQLANANWLGAQTTPGALIVFYSELTNLSSPRLLNAADYATVRLLLVNANASAVGGILPAGAVGGGVIIVDMGQDASGWWMTAAGALEPAHGGDTVVSAAAQGEPSIAAAQAILHAFFARLIPAIMA